MPHTMAVSILFLFLLKKVVAAHPYPQSLPRSTFAFAHLPRLTRRPHSTTLSSTTTKFDKGTNKSDVLSGTTTETSSFWRARENCWRPDVRDVEKISWGMPAKKKGTGSRGVPHRLNQEERRSFDQARRQGFLQVQGSSWRSQRRDAPLLNSYRSLMDARGRPVIVLHKLNPNAGGGNMEDRLVVDLSPLRLPAEFEFVGKELRERVLKEIDVEGTLDDDLADDGGADVVGEEHADGGESSDETMLDASPDNAWETRPIYQLPPYSLSWSVSRQQGKQLGKILALWFDTVEQSAAPSKKPKGVKPGKGRRSGGYGIG